MLLSGFTFIRNARKYDFPILECLESMLPVVDELVVNLGNSEDDTDALVQSLRSPKIRSIRSVWDDTQVEKGLVLSAQTNLALAECRGRWALYLQADEALHEDEHAKIRAAVEAEDRKRDPVEGFRLRYLHFYGGYRTIQQPRKWYASEIRIIRRNSGALSFGDAQTFRGPAQTGFRTLHTELLDAHVFHYGHARNPEKMVQKIRYFHRFWHGDQHGIDVRQAYAAGLRELVWFWGTHPASYARRAAEGARWSFRPSSFLPPGFELKNVIFLADGTGSLAGTRAQVAAELAAFLEARGVSVFWARTFWEWMRLFFRIVRDRRSSALVDLTCESRPVWKWLVWLDAGLWLLPVKVAYVPGSRLPKWARKLFTAISWGSAELRNEGFRVPEEHHARQLARGLGYEP